MFLLHVYFTYLIVFLSYLRTSLHVLVFVYFSLYFFGSVWVYVLLTYYGRFAVFRYDNVIANKMQRCARAMVLL